MDRRTAVAERISRPQHIAAIVEDDSGDLWVSAGADGLGRYEHEPGDFSYWEFRFEEGSESVAFEATALFKDSRGCIWIGTNGGGLYRHYPQKPEFRHYQWEPGRAGGLSDNRVLSIGEDRQGMIWIGTQGGLNRLDPISNIIRRFYASDFLPDNVICGILPDDTGSLWLSTTNGIAKLDPVAEECQAFGAEDGLRGYPFSAGACHRTRTGALIFGGLGGFCMFHPDRLAYNPHEPNIVITSFRKFESEVSFGRSADEIGSITLTYDENFFSFEFAAMDFADTEKNLYAYKLEGLDQEWISCGNRRYANYTKVPPGGYVFRVRGSNNDGLWNEEGASVKIIVVPPFWMTWEFRLLMVLLAAAAVLAVYKLRTKSIKRQRDLLQREVDERIEVEKKLRANQARLRGLAAELTLAEERERHKIALALHDRIGHALLLTKVGLMALAKGDESPPGSQPLDKLIATVNDAMKDARSLTVEISPPSLHKLGLESAVESMVEKVGTENGLKTVVSWEIRSPIAKEVAKGVREVLVNIIKHAAADTIKVSMHNDGEDIIVWIHDNGKGFDTKKFEQDDDDFKGFGLFSIRERMESVGGKFILRSAAGTGTEVTMIAPLHIENEEAAR